ncbi:HAD-IIB family hydrolase [Trichococcus ilyis]|uniref:Cof protein n=1 Tax=Trichococcus ilyis TaxID=640938 RepID=A0A143Z7Y6_9LACT|nr:HAD-IIB family hydrolase [Trichococcus ilyis]CZR06217.1 Hypothetical protein TR210_2298 [Trichococcus ilyis]SEJ64061.1 hypothetical protein SAMN05216375_12029 [Trichococcus ilyis]
MIKLILTDMDGTFLNSQGDFNRELFKQVKQLMTEKGVVFAPCTGKQSERVEEIFGEDAADFWILGDSASRIKRNGAVVYESLLANRTGRAILRELEEMQLGHTLIACTKEAAMIKNDLSPEESAAVRRSYKKVVAVDDFGAIEADFIKITVRDMQERCVGTAEKLSAFRDRAHIVASEKAWLDITDLGVHKGSTIARLQELLQITPEETMVFGDGMNDVEMMKSGRYSFAVRNAYPIIKDTAAFITGRTNDEDAVSHTILQLLALQG